MDQRSFETLLTDVSKHFATPAALAEAKDLTREQKLALLRQWEYDLHLLQVATEENMTGDAPPGTNAEKIRQVHEAAARLGARLDPEKTKSAKAGADIKES